MTPAAYRALAEFRYQIRRFLRFSEQAARAAGLEPQHHQLLLAVKGLPRRGHATVGELAERLQVQHHSAVELIDRLAERRLVRRRRALVDRRQVFVELTPRGETVLRELSLHHLAELAAVRPAVRRLAGALGAHAGSSGDGGGARIHRRRLNDRVERRRRRDGLGGSSRRRAGKAIPRDRPARG